MEFEELYWKEFRRRQAKERLFRKQLVLFGLPVPCKLYIAHTGYVIMTPRMSFCLALSVVLCTVT